jgi:hypothetical protein
VSPIVITVHGTLGGTPRVDAPRWWEINAQPSKDLRQQWGDTFNFRNFDWCDGDVTGPNRESATWRARPYPRATSVSPGAAGDPPHPTVSLLKELMKCFLELSAIDP